MMQAGRLLPAGDVDGRGVIALCRLDAAAILSSLEHLHGVRFGFRGSGTWGSPVRLSDELHLTVCQSDTVVECLLATARVIALCRLDAAAIVSSLEHLHGVPNTPKL